MFETRPHPCEQGDVASFVRQQMLRGKKDSLENSQGEGDRASDSLAAAAMTLGLIPGNRGT